MNITVTDQEQCKKQLRIEIPSEVVREETEKIATNLARQVNVPGFRRGHVPKSVVKSRFRKELRDEVLSHLLPHSLGDAIREKDLKVIGEPSIEDLKFGDDESIDVTFTIEVKPEVNLSNYKSLPLKKRIYKIRDEDVDKTVEQLRQQQAELVPVEDRGAQAGDIVIATLTGHPEPATDQAEAEEQKAEKQKAKESRQESEEVKQEDMEIEIGTEGVLKEFTEALTGVMPGDTRTFDVTYTADYKPEKFAGRRFTYTADVTGVRVKELPEADDEFAQSVGEDFKTLADLRVHIRSTLEHESENRTESEFRSTVMEALVDRNRFPVPEFIIEKQMDSRLNTLLSQFTSQGMDPRRMQVDWEGIREGQRERAEREVRGTFILDRIAETENLEVNDDELDHEIEHYAESINQTVTALKARLTKEGALDSIKSQVRNRKALDFVIASAETQIEEVEGLGEADAIISKGEQAEG
jgi:trigger factor